MNTYTLLALNAATVVIMILLVSQKYGTLLNSITFFGGYWIVTTVLAPVFFLQLKMFAIRKEPINFSILLSAIYFVSLGVAFLLKFSPIRPLLTGLARVSRPFTL